MQGKPQYIVVQAIEQKVTYTAKSFIRPKLNLVMRCFPYISSG
jgi:hypothetical protein